MVISIGQFWLSLLCLPSKCCCTYNSANSVISWLVYNQFQWKEIPIPVDKFTFLKLHYIRIKLFLDYIFKKFCIQRIKYNVVEILWTQVLEISAQYVSTQMYSAYEHSKFREAEQSHSPLKKILVFLPQQWENQSARIVETEVTLK